MHGPAFMADGTQISVAWLDFLSLTTLRAHWRQSLKAIFQGALQNEKIQMASSSCRSMWIC